MGEPQTHHFYDFETFGRVLEPQNQLFVFSETPKIPKIIKKNPNHFPKYWKIYEKFAKKKIK